MNAQSCSYISCRTTGSIDSLSNTITLANMLPVKVGDYIIVEIGTERGQGKRGTLGVGGSWPATRYATEADMNADNSKPTGTYAWVEQTGYTWRRNGSTWIRYTTWDYVTDKALPIALRTKVTAINNNTLTLEKAAQTAATNANVYYDNSFTINEAIASNGSFVIPSGEFAVGELIRIKNKPGRTLKGSGKNSTTLFSPKGCPSANIWALNSDGAIVEDLHLKGNAGADGFGFSWWVSDPDFNFMLPPTTGYWDNPVWQGRGGVCLLSNNAIGRNLKVTDAISYGLQGSGTNTWFYDSDVISTEGEVGYTGWQIHFYNSDSCGAKRCTFTAPIISRCFEFFQSNHGLFEDCYSTNGVWAINSSANILVKNSTIKILPDTRTTATRDLPMIDVNSFQYGSAGTTFENLTMLQTGFQGNGGLVYGIYARANTPNIVVKGGSFTTPEAVQGGDIGLAITCEATNSSIDGFVVNSRVPSDYFNPPYFEPGYSFANISVAGGNNANSIVKNSAAQIIKISSGVAAQNNTCEVCR